MTSKSTRFTGKHMAAVFIGGFGVVIAVNLVMASYAVGSFHGTVVENSYVASQNYNDWLRQAAASKALRMPAEKIFLPMQDGDVPATYASTDALREWVGFAPSTPLAEGIQRFVTWYRQYHKA